MKSSVYDQIREAILTGELAPGQTLSENALAERFGASRTPVREALHRLETEQLLERASRSVHVRETSPEEILDIYYVRISLEGAAAKGAAERASQLDIARLKVAAQNLKDATSPAERALTNRLFHEAMWAASHSPTLIDLLERLNVHLVRYPRTTFEREERWREAIQEHDQILESVINRDGESARQLAEDHMTAAREVRLQMMTEMPKS
ncbi:GntR family transcriptional regulator [Brevibacterium sp. RIT 803]|uniref:GntR family transcriptional regulator n=1 Tax=Brevibacterium sp. RIT 803 TaxID=2810210 RepID=UPI0019507EFF|nr:GntR family transcriptional regulator [Brevibacterium sp. RIT 803]MBM6588932.1 GntR family transcriptional regulator [Brevibacterium sp. RIT 803]